MSEYSWGDVFPLAVSEVDECHRPYLCHPLSSQQHFFTRSASVRTPIQLRCPTGLGLIVWTIMTFFRIAACCQCHLIHNYSMWVSLAAVIILLLMSFLSMHTKCLCKKKKKNHSSLWIHMYRYMCARRYTVIQRQVAMLGKSCFHSFKKCSVRNAAWSLCIAFVVFKTHSCFYKIWLWQKGNVCFDG